MNSTKKMIILSIIFIGVLGLAEYSFAAPPVLNFSDLTSGPATGLGDGLGQGTIVTIWGNNLGSTQGASKVYFKDSAGISREAAYVYEWTNAARHTGHPAELYTFHKMQDIMFSIPSGSATGAGKVYVTVQGVNSNELDFTVRAGNIYYAKQTGNNSTGTGTYSNPWKNVSDFCKSYGSVNGAVTHVSAGDIIYHLGGREVDPNGQNCAAGVNSKTGSSSSPISISAYPGREYLAGDAYFGFLGQYQGNTKWITVSKIDMATGSEGMSFIIEGLRAVGNSITGPTADGQSGAMGGNVGNLKFFGNYIYNFGFSTASKLHHTTYFSNRTGTVKVSPALGWNLLDNNSAWYGVHFYDEGACGDYSGTLYVNNNVIKDQVGDCIGVASSGDTTTCFSMPVNFYNNMCINTGIGTSSTRSPVSIVGWNNKSTIKIYNNTFYGGGDPNYGADEAYLYIIGGSSSYTFGGTYELKNNIFVDTLGTQWELSSPEKTPTVASNNIWYSTHAYQAKPSWDNGVYANPLFTNPLTNDFTLQLSSPGIDNGTSAVAPVVNRDILGTSRPQGANFDIGAYEAGLGASFKVPKATVGGPVTP